MDRQKACLKFASYDICVTFKKVKYARIKISKSGEISMSVPKFYSQTEILEVLLKHEIWIQKTLAKISKNSLEPGKIRYFGEIYNIKFSENFKGVEISQSEILCENLTKFENYAKQILKEKILKFIAKFSPLINKKINHITIRKMTTRWGSCNSKKGYLNFSLSLSQKPEIFIEYVVLHEMTHLIFPHHRSEFYAFIAQILPNYKEIEKLK